MNFFQFIYISLVILFILIPGAVITGNLVIKTDHKWSERTHIVLMALSFTFTVILAMAAIYLPTWF